MFVAPPALQVTGDLPVLTIPGKFSASGAIIVDLQSGQMLHQRSASVERPMASLTKLMTALVIAEKHSMDEMVPIPIDIGSVPGTKAHLPPGDHMSVGDLLSALLIASANDAAETLARFDSGTEAAFVKKMNTRAKELGLRQTVYANPAGLDEKGQYSTPRDTAWLAMFVWRFPEIAKRLAMTKADLQTAKGTKITVTHTHELLHEENSPVMAGKTGTTEGAKQCLLSIVRAGNRQYLVVLLSSSDRYDDMRLMLRALVPEPSVP